MTMLCDCGHHHYSLDHFFKIHGKHLGRIPEHRIKVDVLPDGRVFNERTFRLKKGEEFPILTTKWICKHCGYYNTNSSPASHKSSCKFVKYLKWRETVPY